MNIIYSYATRQWLRRLVASLMSVFLHDLASMRSLTFSCNISGSSRLAKSSSVRSGGPRITYFAISFAQRRKLRAYMSRTTVVEDAGGRGEQQWSTAVEKPRATFVGVSASSTIAPDETKLGCDRQVCPVAFESDNSATRLYLLLILLPRRLQHACAGQPHELDAGRHPLESATDDTVVVQQWRCRR